MHKNFKIAIRKIMNTLILAFIGGILAGHLHAQTTGGLPPIKSTQPGPPKSAPSTRPDSKTNQTTNEQLKFFNAKEIVNDGWRHFAGENGLVDEKKGMDYTFAAIKVLDPEKDKNALSIAKNNISVMYLCAINPSVRNIKAGLSYLQDLNDEFSIDNLIWSAFLRRDPTTNPSRLFEITRQVFPDHPVNKYMEILNGKIPDNMESAYKFLIKMSESGDPVAAMRIGYKYECGFENIDINEAIRWYSLSKELHIKKGSSAKTIDHVSNRINRLILIKEGKFKN